MKQNRYFIIGIILSITIHVFIFLAFSIKIKHPIHHNDIVYIKSQKTPLKSQSSKNPPQKQHKTKKPVRSQKHYEKSYSTNPKPSIDYNKTIPSFKDISTNFSPKKQKPSKIKPQPKPQPIKTSPKTHENPMKTPQKPKNNDKYIPYKHIDIIGYSTDLIDYLERVFKYIHENCKGNGILKVKLYKDGTMNIKPIEKKPVCSKNLQAPPMPNSIMENQIDFLLNTP